MKHLWQFASQFSRYKIPLIVVGIGEKTVVPKLFDEKKFACVRYQLRDGTSKTVLEKCDPCSEFMCGDGQCTRKDWKCNDIKDCLDGSDEVIIVCVTVM